MLSEKFVYEKLNDTKTIHEFLIDSICIFDELVEILINRVFRKTDFVVESVIESLFSISGPLFDLEIKLKILLGLGAINRNVFEDITAFIKFEQQTANINIEFSAQQVINFVLALNLSPRQSLEHIYLNTQEENDKTGLLYQMKLLRQEKLIRSCLLLTINEIYQQLHIESPFI